jgi:hypothetical protein
MPSLPGHRIGSTAINKAIPHGLPASRPRNWREFRFDASPLRQARIGRWHGQRCSGGRLMSRYAQFDRRRISLQDLSQRQHDMHLSEVLPLAPVEEPYQHDEFRQLVDRILLARSASRPVILMMGAHPIKLGLSRYLIDLVGRGIVSLMATNGAGLIHDFELAYFGGTTESVARYIRDGRFGLWSQTGRLNELAREAAHRGEGLGEFVGRVICEEQPSQADISLAAAAWQAGVPLTVHVGIGNDIIHPHANCDGGAWGAASYTDFLIFAEQVTNLDGGVFLNVGTAVMGPEVYLKALSMARNVVHQQGQVIQDITTAVFDLVELPANWRDGTPSKEEPGYYYRPWKTILVRTVADGGTSFYFRGDHRRTIPTLWEMLVSGKSDTEAHG